MTSLLAFGFQVVAAPVVASSAAIPLRASPPMLVKPPPAYTVEPLTARASTKLFALGLQAETDRSEARCARLDREDPPTAVKSPPMYQPPAPSEITTSTVPTTFGNEGGSAPLAASRG